MADIEEYYGIYCDPDGSALMKAMNAEEDYAYGADDFQGHYVSKRKRDLDAQARGFGREPLDSEIPF